jgi:3-phosphoshikimate 1-carboxyvinyltransferase
MTAYLKLSGSCPANFHGSVTLPPSKSYLHRALFVSSLCSTRSIIQMKSSPDFSDDVKASVNALKCFGVRVKKHSKDSQTQVTVYPRAVSSAIVFASGSGTTARFAIAFAAVSEDGASSTISGDSLLSKRPMQPLIDAMSQLGVRCYSKDSNGKLPVVVEGNGIDGGRCTVDGSISSQFVSALLIACTQARKDTILEIENPSEAVSTPYIDATLSVLRKFQFEVEAKEKIGSHSFYIKGNQKKVSGIAFSIPGDMSSGAALIGATLAARGRAVLKGVNFRMPQSDFAILEIAKEFGAKVSQNANSISIISARKMQNGTKRTMSFNLKNSPDLVPIVAGIAAALGQAVKITDVSHLRFKETNRLQTLKRELAKIRLHAVEDGGSLSISESKGSVKKGPIFLSSQKDHRILMCLAIAGLSGRFGELFVAEPDCAAKSYPSFISDLNHLIGKERVLTLVRRKNKRI